MPPTSQIYSIIWWNFMSSLVMSSTTNSDLHLQKFDVDSHKAFPREQSLKTTFQAWDIWMSQQNSTRLRCNQLWKNFSFANISQRNGTFMDRIQFLERSRGCANYKSYNLWAINIKKSTKNLRRCGLFLLLCHFNGHSGHILSKFRSKNVIN